MNTIELMDRIAGATEVKKRAITALSVLNEAYEYPKPSSFSRGLRIDLGSVAILLISGTASIDENGQSVHIGDFPRPASPHLREHHRPLGGRRRNLEGHRPDILLPARHRTRLCRLQRRAHRSSSKSRVWTRCRHPRAFRRFCAGLNC